MYKQYFDASVLNLLTFHPCNYPCVIRFPTLKIVAELAAKEPWSEPPPERRWTISNCLHDVTQNEIRRRQNSKCNLIRPSKFRVWDRKWLHQSNNWNRRPYATNRGPKRKEMRCPKREDSHGLCRTLQTTSASMSWITMSAILAKRTKFIP